MLQLCRTLDASLVSPGYPTPFPNVRHLPDLSEGISFNLANNIWGTNYIMWQPYGGQGATMRFRFEISSEPIGQSGLAVAGHAHAQQYESGLKPLASS